MSVWASFDLVDCWTEGCTGCDECGAGKPYRYEHSGVLPEPDMERGGTVDAGYLSAFVRWNRDHPDTDVQPDGIEPWLRLSVNEASVVLDRAQVEQMVVRLTDWVKWTAAVPIGVGGHDISLAVEQLWASPTPATLAHMTNVNRWWPRRTGS